MNNKICTAKEAVALVKDDFVKIVELEGEEFLYYTAPKPNVAFCAD